jgi:hypothetical protein
MTENSAPESEVHLYNEFHNGDIFYSRPLVRLLEKKYKIHYYHNNNPGLFDDMPHVEEHIGLLSRFPIYHKSSIFGDINTWIGQDSCLFLTSGCSFESYMCLIKKISTTYNLDLKNQDPKDILPKINFSNLVNIEEIYEKIKLLKYMYKKIIFWSNGPVLSGQSENFDFSQYIYDSAESFPDYLHLITNEINTEKMSSNILLTNYITNKFPDLLYLGYISTFCDVIIGRESGPYCFTNVIENIFDPEKKYICFCNDSNGAIWYKERKSDVIWSNNYNPDSIWDIIKNNL